MAYDSRPLVPRRGKRPRAKQHYGKLKFNRSDTCYRLVPKAVRRPLKRFRSYRQDARCIPHEAYCQATIATVCSRWCSSGRGAASLAALGPLRPGSRSDRRRSPLPPAPIFFAVPAQTAFCDLA
jgi:hypothetical protein